MFTTPIMSWRLGAVPRRFPALACSCIAAAASASVEGQAIDNPILRPAAIVAGKYVTADGSIAANVAIILAEGKITQVIPADQLKTTDRVLYVRDGTVCPGLIDVQSALGAYGKVRESAFSIDPGVSALDSLDPRHPDFSRALESGITSVVIAPAPANLVNGAAAVVKTAPQGERNILRSDGPLYFAMGPRAWEPDREPTSRMGAVATLRQVLADASHGRGHRRMQEFADGRLDGVVVCDEPADISATLRTFTGRPRFAIAFMLDEPTLVEELAAAKAPIIFGPLDFAASTRALTLPAALASAGLTVALAGEMPARSGESLRLAAALAVRHGMEPQAARRAITTAAAEVAAVADRTGAIRPGLDADLVIFSDDPLRLDARVLQVYVDGVRVYGVTLATSNGDQS